ncbi:MAG: hypothetical protein PF489_13765 [Salinivirgaceae bacterium]|nr:hypothetical protein [Salinivirgaceae bacterium]
MILSVLLIVAGFGMIHAGKPVIEYTGSAFIAFPAIYLLYLLFRAYGRMAKESENGPHSSD